MEARSSCDRRDLFKSGDAASLHREIRELAAHLKNRYARVGDAIRRGWIRSAKDISEGGLLTAVFEMSLGRGYGLHFEAWQEDPALWFGEGLGGFVFGIDPHVMRELQELLPELKRLGITMNVPVLRWGVGREMDLNFLNEKYQQRGQEGFWR